MKRTAACNGRRQRSLKGLLESAGLAALNTSSFSCAFLPLCPSSSSFTFLSLSTETVRLQCSFLLTSAFVLWCSVESSQEENCCSLISCFELLLSADAYSLLACILILLLSACSNISDMPPHDPSQGPEAWKASLPPCSCRRVLGLEDGYRPREDEQCWPDFENVFSRSSGSESMNND